MFAGEANYPLCTSGDGDVVGRLNTKIFDETGDVRFQLRPDRLSK
jgi:hypothetical protein